MKFHLNLLRLHTLTGKFVSVFCGLMIVVLTLIGTVAVSTLYHDTKQAFLHADAEKADAAAQKIGQIIGELEQKIRWTARARSATPDERRSDDQFILEQTPAMAEIAEFDGSGHPIFKLSRSGWKSANDADYVQAFYAAVADQPQFGPIRTMDDGPRMQLFIAHPGLHADVTIACIDLGFLANIIEGMQAKGTLRAFITTPDGRFTASADEGAATSANLAFEPRSPSDSGAAVRSEDILASSASIPGLDWTLHIERPLSQVNGPVYSLLLPLLCLFVLALALCIGASFLLARQINRPLASLRGAASRLAAGHFDETAVAGTSDEIEALAREFNQMAQRLQDSYTRLRQNAEDRTRELAQSIMELKALEEVGRSVAASLDLTDVLANIVERAADLAQAEGGAIYRFDRNLQSFRLAEAHGLDPGFVDAIRSMRLNRIDGLLSEIAAHKKPIQIPQIADAMDFPLRAATLGAGFQSALIVPLVGSSEVLGVLIVERRKAGRFPANTAALMQSFAHQCVVAISNANLFHEVEEKGRQLAIVSAHKSQFFTNMSHELRTPLNAILGYAELLQDSLYGTLPETAKPIISRVQNNGTHLLGLINDILDMAKMEAGEMSLQLEAYSMKSVIEAVIDTTGALAHAKSLQVKQEILDVLPAGFGDERRLTQVLLNIVSNAIKFTETGSVTIRAKVVDEDFELSVEDTGAGIAPEEQARIFEAFQQVDNTSTRLKGGTGLGLSISKRFVEMHGGTIDVMSEQGKGSVFRILVPIRVNEQRCAA